MGVESRIRGSRALTRLDWQSSSLLPPPTSLQQHVGQAAGGQEPGGDSLHGELPLPSHSPLLR
jgi:hypothetical protein